MVEQRLQPTPRQQRAHRTHTHTEHARTHAHTHTFKHTHIHTHTHSHTHTHIHKHASKFFHSALKSVTFPPSPELSLSTDGDLQKNKTRETRQGFVRIADFRLYFPFLWHLTCHAEIPLCNEYTEHPDTINKKYSDVIFTTEISFVQHLIILKYLYIHTYITCFRCLNIFTCYTFYWKS